MLAAAHPRRRRADHHLRGGQVQRSPLPLALPLVIPRSAPPAHAAAPCRPPRRPRPHHHHAAIELDPLDDDLLEAQKPPQHAVCAHAAPCLSSEPAVDSRNRTSTAARAPLPTHVNSRTALLWRWAPSRLTLASTVRGGDGRAGCRSRVDGERSCPRHATRDLDVRVAVTQIIGAGGPVARTGLSIAA